jgi:hypothetical protein
VEFKSLQNRALNVKRVDSIQLPRRVIVHKKIIWNDMNYLIIGSIVLVAIIAMFVIFFIVKRGKCVVPPGTNTCDDGKAWMCLSEDANPTCQPIDQVCGPTTCTEKQYKTIECVYDDTKKIYAWSCSGTPDVVSSGQYFQIDKASSSKLLPSEVQTYNSDDMIGTFVQGSVDDAFRACAANSTCKSFEYGYNFNNKSFPSDDVVNDSRNPKLYESDGYQLLNTNDFRSSFYGYDALMRRVDGKLWITKYIPITSNDITIDGLKTYDGISSQTDKDTCFSSCESDSNCTYASFNGSNTCVKGSNYSVKKINPALVDTNAQLLIKKSTSGT